MFWNNIKYFKPYEFDSPDLKGSGLNMDENFILLLDTLREECGHPLRINSGFRTVEHNAAVEGKAESAHLKGLAADIHCTSSNQRFHLLRIAFQMGFQRIGIGRSFLHLDTDRSLPQEVTWLY